MDPSGAKRSGRVGPSLGDGPNESLGEPAKHFRRGDIQGLRAIAVLMVVAFHAGLPLPGGFVGVDVFFVISGFVITAMLEREFGRSGRVKLTRFYWRRFKRLTPALALAVTATLGVSLFILSPTGPLQATAATGAGALLLVANFVISQGTGGYFGARAESNALLNTWSLSVEEQFYLVFPALLVAILVWRRGAKISVIVTLVLGAGASFVLAVLGSSSIWHLDVAGALVGFYSPVTRAWEFAAGALLAVAIGSMRNPGPSRAVFAGLVGLGGLAAASFMIGPSTPFPGVWTLLPVGATVALIYAGGSRNYVSAMLARSGMQSIGNCSYSIYLWHWPIIVLASATWPGIWWIPPAAALLSFVPAYFSYRWLESPVRSMSLKRARSKVILFVFTLVPPVLLAGVALFLAGQFNADQQVQQLVAAVGSEHQGRAAGCDELATRGTPIAGSCTWNHEALGRPIYLVGDSNADHFSEAVNGAAENLGRPVTLLENNDCPFAELTIAKNREAKLTEECHEFVEMTKAFLADAPGGDVLIATSDGYAYNEIYAFGRPGGPLTRDSTEKIEVFRTGLSSTTDYVSAAGHDVTLVKGVPLWKGPFAWDPSNCGIWQFWHGGGCQASAGMDEMQSAQSGVRDAVMEVASRGDYQVIDPFPWLCPDGICRTHEARFVRFSDSGHLSTEQSRALIDEFTVALSGR